MMKRPERKLYIAPALRSKYNNDCRIKMEDEYGSEGYRDGSLRRSTNIARRRVQWESSSSSSNQRYVSDKSCKDYDSSDFEESCSAPIEPMEDEIITMGSSENNSNDRWNEDGTGNHAKNNHYIEADSESHANKSLNSASNEAKVDTPFFNNDDDSLSDIEAIIDSHMTKGRFLTSTPNSDIEEQNILDAAKYDPEEESGMESTLIDKSDIREITMNTNRNKCDNNFDIYQDPSPVKSQPSDFSEIFGNNYIPPPVPPPISAFQLPPIHRLPSPIPSPNQVSVIQVSPLPLQLQHPKPLLPSSLLCPRVSIPSPTIPSNSSHMPPVPRCALPPHLQPAISSVPNRPSVPPSISPTFMPQVRFHPPHPSQDASNPVYLHQRRASPQSIESNKRDDPFYIPPPVPPPHQIHVRQQIRNLNQRVNVQSCQPDSISLENKIIFDDKIWPQNPKGRR